MPLCVCVDAGAEIRVGERNGRRGRKEFRQLVALLLRYVETLSQHRSRCCLLNLSHLEGGRSGRDRICHVASVSPGWLECNGRHRVRDRDSTAQRSVAADRGSG